MLLPQSFQIGGCVYFLLFYLLSVQGLHYCTGFSLVAAIGGYSSCGAHASHSSGFLAAEHGPWGAAASVLAVRGLRSC